MSNFLNAKNQVSSEMSYHLKKKKAPSGSNLPCIVTTVRCEAGEAGLQLAIEPLALQTEGLGLLQIHFYFPGQRLYSLLA